jgi:hypothetical protein
MLGRRRWLDLRLRLWLSWLLSCLSALAGGLAIRFAWDRAGPYS